MKNNDETILEILQGHKTVKWPTPKLVKIFIASNRPEFINERRILLENVGPELQTFFDNEKIEVELVDMHFGASKRDSFDPKLFEDHLHEIRMCHKLSRGCFFLCLAGSKYEPFIVPPRLEIKNYQALLDKAQELKLNCDILEKWYTKDGNEFVLKDCTRSTTTEEWEKLTEEIINLIYECVINMTDALKKKISNYLKSVVEQQFNFALGLAPGTAHHVLTIIRNWTIVPEETELFNKENSCSNIKLEAFCKDQLDKFHSNVKHLVPDENTLCFKVPWQSGGIDADEHEDYLSDFKSRILNKLKGLIRKSLDDEPELKSKKKIVEENFQENITHLTYCYEDIKLDFSNSDLLEKIKQIVQNSNNVRHSPILIYGNSGSGRTSLIQTLYRNFETWFQCRTLRIIRFASTTPRSSYNLELLRVICQQICITLKLPEGFLPKDASFDPLYINNWFQTLLRNFEDMNQVLVIFIDDIHLINPLDSEYNSALSWLPLTLPKQVHIICTTGVELEFIRMTPVQKERFKKAETYLEISPSNGFKEFIVSVFEKSETVFSREAVAKLSLLISCSQYGLTETELLEVLMPTNNSEELIEIEKANFNFSSLCSIRRKWGSLLRDKIVGDRLLVHWNHPLVREVVMERYLQNNDHLKTIHSELTQVYFSEFCREIGEDEEEEEEEEPAPLLSEIRETPFQSTVYKDVTYSQRHIEEAWIHLLLCGDTIKLKTLCMCNYDFLLAALQTFSISYLRCILEHVRCYLLDRDIELVYYSIRKSTDVLTRDTYQLGTQLISWLRPVVERGGSLMNTLVTSAMAWCDGFTLPLVVPLTDWLQPPLPLQSKVINTPNVRLIEITPSGQHVITVLENELELWHIMSNNLVHTFKGC